MAAELDKTLRAWIPGKMSAKFPDKVRHFEYFAPGENAATYAAATDVGRLLLAGAETEDGFPLLEIRISNVRLDTLELPVTFPLDARTKKTFPRVGGEDPELSIRYYIDRARFWRLDPRDTLAGKNRVTLDSFAAGKLRGTLQARLVPNRDGMGEVLEITDGAFEIEPRLRGIRASKDDPAADAESPATVD
jgi:hypothetical protein